MHLSPPLQPAGARSLRSGNRRTFCAAGPLDPAVFGGKAVGPRVVVLARAFGCLTSDPEGFLRCTAAHLTAPLGWPPRRGWLARAGAATKCAELAAAACGRPHAARLAMLQPLTAASRLPFGRLQLWQRPRLCSAHARASAAVCMLSRRVGCACRGRAPPLFGLGARLWRPPSLGGALCSTQACVCFPGGRGLWWPPPRCARRAPRAARGVRVVGRGPLLVCT
ncbi:MAG: hypothetical protein J3K34DRAFT_447330 [Monoraphidium minutum]|nr:MAG: hypothetical protein J3K34DRAFT_447330 [Monoraphidium minutum]